MVIKNKIVCVSCSIFKKELITMKKNAGWDMDCVFHSSMLHMHPDLLDGKLQKDMAKFLKRDKKILFLYGDCSPYISNIENTKGIIRTKGINCIEILLGTEIYRQLRKEGAFFLMPEWTLRWKEVFQFEMKLENSIAKEFMQEFHTRIVYIDTGNIKIPSKQLIEIEEYTGLKVEIMKNDTNKLKNSLTNALKDLDAETENDEN